MILSNSKSGNFHIITQTYQQDQKKPLKQLLDRYSQLTSIDEWGIRRPTSVNVKYFICNTVYYDQDFQKELIIFLLKT